MLVTLTRKVTDGETTKEETICGESQITFLQCIEVFKAWNTHDISPSAIDANILKILEDLALESADPDHWVCHTDAFIAAKAEVLKHIGIDDWDRKIRVKECR